jgi:carbamoylphosphate synthase large subunit
MLNLFEENGIEIYVPLVDADVHCFPVDSSELVRRRIRSTGIQSSVSGIIRDKRALSSFLESQGICVPRTLSREQIGESPGGTLFVKPAEGFGSKGARPVSSDNALRALAEDPSLIVQELCGGPEVTVEVFNREGVSSICRERIETKAGVCTKARVFADRDLHLLAERLCGVLDLPVAFCFQVMCRSDGEWAVTDLNPRLGAGTALSTAYGWSLASAALVCWGDLPFDPREFLKTASTDRYVVRVYQEQVLG